MASKAGGPADFDEQLLTCPVCLLHFRDPRVLPCLHTVCEECLLELAAKQQQLECPTCHTRVSLPDQGVDGLMGNFYVNNLLDLAAVKKGAEPGVPCQVCKEGQGEVKSWCKECSVLLCERCAQVHRKIPAKKNHEVVPQEAIESTRGLERIQRRKHCSKHPKHELDFFCESCAAMICTECTVVDHRPSKGHNTVEISSVARTKKQNLQSLTQQLEPRFKDARKAAEKIAKEREKLPNSRKEAIDQATAYFRHLVDLAKRQEEETLAKIDATCQEIDKGLETHKVEVEFEAAGLISAHAFCQQAMVHGSDVDIVEVEGQVQKRVEDLLARQTDVTPRPGEVKFVENTTVTDLEKQLRQLVTVAAKRAVDVTKCDVVVRPTVAGFVNVCLLRANDENGQPCDVRRDDVTANMKGPSGHPVQTQLEHTREGLWEISYAPQVIGNHTLEVKVNSHHVIGSPFEVPVQSSDTSVLTIGRKGSGVGELNGPIGVAVDKDGNLAVVECANKRVQIFDAYKGHCLKCFSVEGQVPYDIDVEPDGRFVVTSSGKNCGVRRYSQDGELLNTYKLDCVEDLMGVAVLKDGRMVVVDLTHKCCLLLRNDGSLIRDIGKGRLKNPWFIAVDESRDLLFVTDFAIPNKVLAFGLEGELKFCFGEGGQGEGQFLFPTGIAVDPTGNVIVVDLQYERLQVFGPDGTFKRVVATVRDGEPFGITLTPDGYIAVACAGEKCCIEMYRYN